MLIANKTLRVTYVTDLLYPCHSASSNSRADWQGCCLSGCMCSPCTGRGGGCTRPRITMMPHHGFIRHPRARVANGRTAKLKNIRSHAHTVIVTAAETASIGTFSLRTISCRSERELPRCSAHAVVSFIPPLAWYLDEAVSSGVDSPFSFGARIRCVIEDCKAFHVRKSRHVLLKNQAVDVTP